MSPELRKKKMEKTNYREMLELIQRLMDEGVLEEWTVVTYEDRLKQAEDD